MGLHIQNGSTVNVSWLGTIALSLDGTNWSTYPKDQIRVGIENVNTNSADPNYIPFETSEKRVFIRNINNDDIIARFLVSEVDNHPGWTNVDLAVKAINEWIGEVYP